MNFHNFIIIHELKSYNKLSYLPIFLDLGLVVKGHEMATGMPTLPQQS